MQDLQQMLGPLNTYLHRKVHNYWFFTAVVEKEKAEAIIRLLKNKTGYWLEGKCRSKICQNRCFRRIEFFTKRGDKRRFNDDLHIGLHRIKNGDKITLYCYLKSDNNDLNKTVRDFYRRNGRCKYGRSTTRKCESDCYAHTQWLDKLDLENHEIINNKNSEQNHVVRSGHDSAKQEPSYYYGDNNINCLLWLPRSTSGPRIQSITPVDQDLFYSNF